MEEKPLKNYIIPYGERFTTIGNTCFTAQTLMCVDGIGLIVNHKSGYKPTEEDVRSHLIGYQKHTMIIQGESLFKAVETFYNYEECKIGLKYKAWEMIDSEDRPIREYPKCKHIRIKHEPVCAAYDEPTEDGCMTCVLSGNDEPPTNCPIDKVLSNDNEIVQQNGGIWVERYYRSVTP